jgi:tetratricopeptide (TPR) repeat protein
LFLISAVLSIATVSSGAQTLMPITRASPAARAANALLSCAIYLRQTFYPAGLSAFVPYPIHSAPLWEIALASAILAFVTIAAIAWRRTHPWLFVGWFWYLGMLIPMLGFLQAGEQAHADRFTYLPQIGLLLAIVWSARHWVETRLDPRLVLAASSATLMALLVCARIQASYWRDSITLWTRVLACTSDNNFAQNNMGVALIGLGKVDEAATHFQAAIALEPRNMRAQFNLGNAMMVKGRADEAIALYRTALAIDPTYFDALNNLGIALASKGRNTEAAEAYRRALALEPQAAKAHDNLGRALLNAGRVAEARAQFEKAIEIAPTHERSYEGLGSALIMANRPAEAERCYRKAIELQPEDEAARAGFANALFLQGRAVEAVENWRKALLLKPVKPATLNNLAWVLATGPDGLRSGAEAVQMAELSVKLAGGANPTLMRTLAAAHAEAGQFLEARQTAAAALDLATAQSNGALSAKIESDLQQYNANCAIRNSPAAAAGQ